ncbi:MAG: hypothetical protein ACSHWW_11505 [Nonlabens sp.]|uniref:hypothetical protein n=1 Tax=Nonlabens sp. TaxID=1888209 RepID=UPI003EF57BB5
MRLFYFILISCIVCCSNNEKRQSVFDDFLEGEKHAIENDKNLLVIFDNLSNPTNSVNSKIHHPNFQDALDDYIIVKLNIDDKLKGPRNLEFQKENFKTNYQPAYYILKKGDVVKGPLGYCMDDEFIDFVAMSK